MRTVRISIFIFLASVSGCRVQAQDTLRVTLYQADSLMIHRNLLLIANRYEVDKAEARKIQEKLFINPELSGEWNLYNPSEKKIFDAGPNGQKIVQIQKVFRIAGQRKASIQLAEEEQRMTALQFDELARVLKYELHVSFYRYFFLNNAISNISSRLALLKNLITIYEQQYIKENISLQELARLKSVYFEINNQVNETRTELVRLQERLQLLLSDTRVILPAPIAEETVIASLSDWKLEDLQQRSIRNRPEIKIAQSIQSQQQLQYTIEKKQAIPNLTTGFQYDQAGSYIKNYTGLSVGLQIPLFNRNQGRIQESRIGIRQSEVMLQTREMEITREVAAAWNIFQLLREQFHAAGTDFEAQLDLLSKGLVSNYSKNNISLLEFTDMFEAYNSSIIELNQLKADLNKSYEELNYAVGENLGQ